MKRKRVKSSCIASYAYDKGKRALEIEFSHGDVYDYLNVPPSVHEEFLRADSKGKFVNSRIKKFPFRKISAERDSGES